MTHNNYITLTVLFMMLSNHYPVTYSNASVIPALVTLVIIAGALVRYFYNMWHGDHDNAMVGVVRRGGRIWVAFSVCMPASPGMREVIGLAPTPPVAIASANLPKRPPMSSMSFRRAVRCAIRLCSKALARRRRVYFRHARSPNTAIRTQAVMSHAMPPNNITEMTPQERAILARWLAAIKSRRTEKAWDMNDAATSPGQRLMGARTSSRLSATRSYRGSTSFQLLSAISPGAARSALPQSWARYEGKQPGAPARTIGSHIDRTARDAGRYDGGALAAAVVEELVKKNERLDVAVEIVAEGDDLDRVIEPLALRASSSTTASAASAPRLPS